jgi:UPF0176 protein
MYKIAALYHFTRLENLPELRVLLRAEFVAHNLCGTLLLAPEGINGTLAGSEADVAAMLDILTQRTGLLSDNVKFSFTAEKPFKRLKIRLKREIITFKQSTDLDTIGTYVAPEEWNALLADPDVVVLDTRNRYETELGTFAGAQDPKIDTFTQFADYVRENLNPAQHKKIAMYCTGGIRCEKASAYMLAKGFSQVYHLKGGILKYLETIPPAQSKWQGECFVFDQRIAVGHGIAPTTYETD